MARIRLPWAGVGLALLLLFVPTVALAHAQVGLAGGFASGSMHPILGADHLVAMIAACR
jgi:urease accessory protein